MSDNNGAKAVEMIYSRMSTEQIKNMLRYSAMSEEELDMELVNCLLAELKQREPESKGMSALEAWEDFNENWSGSETVYPCFAERPGVETNQNAIYGNKPKHRKSFKTLLVAAIVVVLVFTTMIVAQASGVDVFGALARWTSETFSFGNSRIAKDDDIAIAFENWTEGKTYDSLQDALDDFAITEFSEPELPEGSELKELKVSADLEDQTFWGRASYTYKESNISVSCKYTPPGRSHSTIYEKSDVEPELYNSGEYSYYLFPNNSRNAIVWLTENFECRISGELTFDELKQIVDSIY